MRKTAAEILKMVDGEPVLALQGTIKSVYPWKSGTSEKGAWSFQDLVLQDETGEVRLKAVNLDDLRDLKGKDVTIEAHKSDKFGWTGVKKLVEDYQGKTYHKIKLTATCKIKELGANGATPAPATVGDARKVFASPATTVEYDEDAAVRDARAFAMKMANALLIALEATRYVAGEFEKKHLGESLSGEQQQAMCSSIFISMDKQGVGSKLPAHPLKPLVRESVLPEKIVKAADVLDQGLHGGVEEEIPW